MKLAMMSLSVTISGFNISNLGTILKSNDFGQFYNAWFLLWDKNHKDLRFWLNDNAMFYKTSIEKK